MTEKTPGRLGGDPTPPSDPAREAFTTALGEYQQLVEGSEIVAASIVGGKPGFRTGHIWSVLAHNYSPEEMHGCDFDKLREAAIRTTAASRDYMPLRIAYVLPSRVGELLRTYHENGHELQDVDEDVLNKTLQSEQVPVGNLDILVGEAPSADEKIHIAQELATKARQYHGREDDYVYNLTIFDDLQDEEAGELLKNIALARNNRINPPNMASTFELMAEPSRVVGEIVSNLYDKSSLRSITTLDVRNAIESGALIPHYGLPREQP